MSETIPKTIKNSEKYERFLMEIGTSHEEADDQSYRYQPHDRADVNYTVVIPVQNEMELVFEIDGDDRIVGSDMRVDTMSGIGKPQKVDEHLDEKKSIREKAQAAVS